MSRVYKEFPESEFTYVVIHSTGYGVQEYPTTDVGLVYGSDDLQEAINEASKLSILNSTEEEIKSSWRFNHYNVAVNTSTKAGKVLHEEFCYQFDKMWESLPEDDYTTSVIGGLTIKMQKSPLLDN